MWDTIVVGGGPAGLSCALLLGRCCRRVLVLDAGRPRNARAPAVNGYLTRDGTPPDVLRALGRQEVERYGGRIVHATVRDVTRPGPWSVHHDGGVAPARTLVLATGIRDVLPAIPGVAPFWGRSVVTCPYCDAYERRGAPLAVYGWDDEAAEAALGLLTWTDRVTLCTDGRAPPADPRLARYGVDVRASPILFLDGRSELEAVRFADGTDIACTCLFVHAGQRPADPLVAALGCTLMSNGCVQVDDEGHTGVPDLWACGDASTGTQLVVAAAAEGARAAVSVNRALRVLDRP